MVTQGARIGQRQVRKEGGFAAARITNDHNSRIALEGRSDGQITGIAMKFSAATACAFIHGG